LDQLDRLDLRLDARAGASRQPRQQRGTGEVRIHARNRHRLDGRVGFHDQGPRLARRPRSEVALDHRLPRQDRREPEEGDPRLRLSFSWAAPAAPVRIRLYLWPSGSLNRCMATPNQASYITYMNIALATPLTVDP